MEIRNGSIGYLQTPSQSKIATVLTERRQAHSLRLWQQDVVVFCIAIAIAIRKTASSCAINHFPDHANEHSKSTVVSTSCVLVPKYCESLPTERGDNHNEVCNVGWSERVRSGGGTLHCGYSPDSPKMWPACLVTSSSGNNRFRNESFGLTANKI